ISAFYKVSMAKDGNKANKGPFSAIVVSNRQVVNCIYRLGLELGGDGAKAFGQCPAEGDATEAFQFLRY
ncbi:MAG: hypothetical protein ACYTBV_15610, partial [Planctomycetota bacterium]